MAMDFKLSLVLQAAEMLEQPKLQQFAAFTPMMLVHRAAQPADDGAVPDLAASTRAPRHRSPFAYDEDGAGASDDASSGIDGEEQASKRARMASSRALNARNSDTHNSVEKRRRAYLASCYDGLRDVVPALACSRSSNVKVLRSASTYIKQLQADERRFLLEKQRLVEQQQELLRERERRLRENEATAMTVPVLSHAPMLSHAPALSPAPMLSHAPRLSHAPMLLHAPRRTSSDNDVAFTLMQLARTAA